MAATIERPPVVDREGMDRSVGLLGLMWASEGSIIGSGWLFGAFYAVTGAGPAALIGWGIASIIIIALAMVHAELGGMFPVTGGTTRFPHYAFGSFAGATFGWFAYIQAAAVAPIEVLAAVQYISTAHFARNWYKASTVTGSPGTLSHAGIVAAVILMLVFVVLNVIGIRWLARTNTTITTWKVIIPVLTVIVLLLTHFHSGNFTAGGGFFVKGAAVRSILVAIPGAGIVFSLLGFEQAVQLGGESARPQRDLPRAVIGSILIGAAVYILLQLAFIGGLSPATITHYHTWANLSTDSTLGAGPFYTVTKVAGLAWLAYLLRIDAVISPGGTGLIYLTSSSRISFGLSKNGYVPSAFEKNNARTRVPVFGIIIATLIGLLFLLPFPSWSSLVNIVTGASVLMYAGAPLALGALRRSKPDLPRSYRLPYGGIWAPVAFILANWVVFWAGWGTVSTLMVVIILGYILMAVSRALRLNPNAPRIDWRAGWWIIPYLIGTAVISYFGSFGTDGHAIGIINGLGPFKHFLVGAHGDLPLYWDLLVLAVFSLIIYFLAITSRLSSAEVDAYVADVYTPEPGEVIPA